MAFQLDRLDENRLALTPRAHRLIIVANRPYTLADLLAPEVFDHAVLQTAKIASVYEHRLLLRDLPEATARNLASQLSAAPGLRLISLEHLIGAYAA